ncbi:actin nucleation-promoting factor WASL-like [Pongo pygmaeus]|uniref:actin nucleation-promoting factor WASL-like n=1 Tax=Pongo pygmaeus TaxID=9600 RepID=UPI00300CC033
MARRRAASDAWSGGRGRARHRLPPAARVSPGLAKGQLRPRWRLGPLRLPGRGAPPGRAETAAPPRPALQRPPPPPRGTPCRDSVSRAETLCRSPGVPSLSVPFAGNLLSSPPRPPAGNLDPDPRRPAQPRMPLFSRHGLAPRGISLASARDAAKAGACVNSLGPPLPRTGVFLRLESLSALTRPGPSSPIGF